MTDTPLPPGLSNDELDELDQILTDLGQRVEEIPQWEFCDGFLTALVCMRRRVEPAEYLPMLLDDGAVLEVAADAPLPLLPAFQDAAQQARFLELWQRRWDEVAHQLAAGDVLQLHFGAEEHRRAVGRCGVHHLQHFEPLAEVAHAAVDLA